LDETFIKIPGVNLLSKDDYPNKKNCRIGHGACGIYTGFGFQLSNLNKI
jgi:hypothetical protein